MDGRARPRNLSLSILALCLILILRSAPAVNGQNLTSGPELQRATAKVKRLSPSAVRELPPHVARALRADGCLIPQPGPSLDSYLSKPYNAIHGAFARKGEVDWAVACSRLVTEPALIEWHRTSPHGGKTTVARPRVWKTAVLVFFAKPSHCPTKILEFEDQARLEGGVDGRLAFNFAIKPVEEKDVLGMANPPPPGLMKHEGIALLNEIARAFYCDGTQWKEVAAGD